MKKFICLLFFLPFVIEFAVAKTEIISQTFGMIKIFDIPMNIILFVEGQFNKAHRIIAPVTKTLLVLEITIIGIMLASGNMDSGGAVMMRLLKIVFILYIVLNIEYFAFTLLSGFRYFASSIANGVLDFDKVFSNPVEMFNEIKAMYVDMLNEQVQAGITKTGKLNIIQNAVNDVRLIFSNFFSLIMVMLVYLFLFLMVFQLLIAKLEFAVVVLFSIVLAPFMLSEKLKFLSDKVFSAIFGSALKVGMVYFFMALVYKQLTMGAAKLVTKDLTIFHSLNIVLLVFFCLYLVFYGPKITNTLLSGSPSLGASQMLQMASQIAIVSSATKYMARNVGKMAKSVGGAAKKAGAAVSSGYGAYTSGYVNKTLARPGGVRGGMQAVGQHMKQNMSEMYGKKNKPPTAYQKGYEQARKNIFGG